MQQQYGGHTMQAGQQHQHAANAAQQHHHQMPQGPPGGQGALLQHGMVQPHSHSHSGPSMGMQHHHQQHQQQHPQQPGSITMMTQQSSLAQHQPHPADHSRQQHQQHPQHAQYQQQHQQGVGAPQAASAQHQQHQVQVQHQHHQQQVAGAVAGGGGAGGMVHHHQQYQQQVPPQNYPTQHQQQAVATGMQMVGGAPPQAHPQLPPHQQHLAGGGAGGGSSAAQQAPHVVMQHQQQAAPAHHQMPQQQMGGAAGVGGGAGGAPQHHVMAPPPQHPHAVVSHAHAAQQHVVPPSQQHVVPQHHQQQHQSYQQQHSANPPIPHPHQMGVVAAGGGQHQPGVVGGGPPPAAGVVGGPPGAAGGGPPPTGAPPPPGQQHQMSTAGGPLGPQQHHVPQHHQHQHSCVQGSGSAGAGVNTGSNAMQPPGAGVGPTAGGMGGQQQHSSGPPHQHHHTTASNPTSTASTHQHINQQHGGAAGAGGGAGGHQAVQGGAAGAAGGAGGAGGGDKQATGQGQNQPAAKDRRVRVEAGYHSDSSSEKWAVPPRYKLVKVIGSGSYGKVCHALDQETGSSVAIKKIKRIFEDLIDCKRLLREIAILAFLDDPRVVRLIDVCVPEDPRNFSELYLVLELCDSDLKKLFKLPEFLSENHVVTLLFNTLCGLKYIHSAGIYHRDLKPANCLVNRDCSVKVCDFGLSRPVVDPENDMLSNIDSNGYPSSMDDSQQSDRTRRLTGHVVTRWYRAPELILLQENYTEQIDVWSLGCIFAELLGMIHANYPNSKDRCPLFQGNTCYPLSPHKEHDKEYQYYYNRQSRDQLNVIFNILGTPSEATVEKLDKIDAKRYVRCFRERRRLNWDELPRLAGSSAEALDLLDKMLSYSDYDTSFENKQLQPVLNLVMDMMLDAGDRIDVDTALQHPLFSNLYSPEKVRTAERKIVLEFENIPNLGEPQLRLYFLLEIQKFHPELVIPDELLMLRASNY